MNFKVWRIPATALFFAAVLLSTACREHGGPVQTSPWTWEGVQRIVAVGDTHGGFDKVQELLPGLGLVDRDLHWTGGNTHLVFVGDLTDRGPGERPLLDLVRRLQGEAEAMGGRVHVLLGNHEVMNMMQDLRYVSPEGYEAFRAGEDISEGYPPGYLGRRNAFGPEGAYSRWLLDQQIIIRINRFVFVHGGLTRESARMGYEEIDRLVKGGVRKYWEWREVLIDSGRVTVFDDFRRTQEIAEELLSETTSRREMEAAAGLRQTLNNPGVTRRGPLWYRGSSREDERVEGDRVTASLELLDGRAMVVGHSITPEGRITSRFEGRVYRIDVGMAYPDGGDPQALIIEGDEIQVFNARTGRLTVAEVEPPEGEYGSQNTDP